MKLEFAGEIIFFNKFFDHSFEFVVRDVLEAGHDGADGVVWSDGDLSFAIIWVFLENELVESAGEDNFFWQEFCRRLGRFLEIV